MGDKEFRPIITEGLLRWHALGIHLDPASYHSTSPQILRRIKQQFYVMDDDVVRNEINRCFICQIATQNSHTRHKFAMQRLPERPRTHVSFDICCGLPDDSNRYRYIFCVVDQYSNYTIAAAARTRSTEEIINFFRQALFAYSVPSLLLCDGEPGLLNSQTFDDFLSLYDIQKQRTSLAFPQSNGLSERTNFFIKRCLRCFALTDKDNWSNHLPHVVSSINNAILCNNFSPNQITFVIMTNTGLTY